VSYLPRFKSSLASVLVGLLVLGAVPARAAPIGLTGDTVNVRLVGSFPTTPPTTPPTTTSVDVSDNVVVGPGVEISGNDTSTNLGNSGWLSPGSGVPGDGESINIGAFSIVLRILWGAGTGAVGDPLVTGWDAGTKYILSSLDLAPADNLEIYGVSAAATGGTISNFSSSWASFDDPHQISFALDKIQFNPATSGTTFGEVTLSLLTRTTTVTPPTPAPEPGSLALAGLALAVAWGVGRRRAPQRVTG
jgi:hypothetical protein